MPPPSPAEVTAAYEERIRTLEGALGAAEARSARMGNARLVAFLGAVAALFGGRHPLALTLLAASVFGFVALVVRHRGVARTVRRLGATLELCREGPLRIARDWRALPPAWTREAPHGHAYASDLDVTGHASLLHLLGTVATQPGRETLARWLLEPAPPEVVLRRQEAVTELAGRDDFREQVAVEGRLGQEGRRAELEAFRGWALEEPWLLPRTRVLVAALLLPLPTIALGVYDFTVVGGAPWWILPLALQVLLVRAHRARIHADFRRLPPESGVVGYVPILGRIEREELEAPRLRELRHRLVPEEGHSAHEELRRLARRMDLTETRRSWLHPVLDVLLHWDIHVQRSLERWKARWGGSVGDWLDALGEVDALCALATLAHDHPDWSLPRFHAEPVLRARALGHPLLAPARCVRNDVDVGPPGTFVLVTGSNMSGKSTLLRAVGTNAALAQAGGPVCAAQMSLPAVRLWTSMRVVDSLQEGVSQFLAELERLRNVVEAAARTEGEPPLLYLLDEILQGTNSAERQIAARSVLRHLLERRALGLVSTHDLALADAPDLHERARAVHFRDSVREPGAAGPPLSFDYRLRPGTATSTNAVRLMEMVGIERRAADGADESAPGER